MKKKIYFSLGGLIVLIFLGLIFFFPKKIEHGMQNSNSQTIITKQDNGKEISLREGEIFQIELEENGSTGYIWQIDNLDKTYFELIAEETRQAETEKNLVGAPVIGVWKIKALKKGSSDIKMDYYRSWEGKESAIDHFKVNIQID